MLDLHCHILPAVDDGPPTLDEALALARFCVKDGITHVVATPHCHRHTRTLRADVLPHAARFNAELDAAGLPLTVLPGSEVQVTDADEYRREYDAGLYCHLNDNPAFTLLEFSWHARLYPPGAAELVAWLVGRGTRPVIAHPERHDFFREGPDRLRALAGAGAWLQVTVDSLLGNHGPAPRASADELLRLYPEAVLATDAHNTRRCSGLSAGYRLVRERFGPAREEDLRARADHILRRILAAPSPGGAAVNSPG